MIRINSISKYLANSNIFLFSFSIVLSLSNIQLKSLNNIIDNKIEAQYTPTILINNFRSCLNISLYISYQLYYIENQIHIFYLKS